MAVDTGARDVPDRSSLHLLAWLSSAAHLVRRLRRQKAQPYLVATASPTTARHRGFADLIENAPHGVAWHTQAETDRLIGMMTPVHIAKLDAAKRDGKRMVGGLYKRMRDEAGGRVGASKFDLMMLPDAVRMPTGGSSRQTVMIVDGDTVRSRALSPREAAQG